MDEAAGCLKRLRAMPVTRVVFGDDPMPPVLLLVLVMFLLPSGGSAWLALGMLLAVAVFLRVWLLCREPVANERV